MDGWYGLTEHERYQYALRVPCPLCQTSHYRDCRPHGGEGRVGMVQRHVGQWDHSNGVVGMHHERESLGRRVYEDEVRNHAIKVQAAALKLDSEINRTCPWCGTLFDTVILMEEHEVECDN